jgi:D-sedoheptulose 7-phosphate isomerase
VTADEINRVKAYIGVATDLQRHVADECASQIVEVSRLLSEAFASGKKVLLCGNGGSAADCQHMAAELVSRLSRDFERPPLPAVALTTDTSFITAYGNDYGFDGIFQRQVEALGRDGDVLVAISTSGESANVRRAIVAGKARAMTTVCLTGADGALEHEVDCAVVIPSHETQHIQEAMLPVEHLICALVEQRVFGSQGKQDQE